MIKHIIKRYPNYNLKSYKEYIDNVLTQTEYYDEQGNLYKIKGIDETNQNYTYEEKYKNGQLHGIRKEWTNEKILFKSTKYKNGMLHGTHKLFYPSSGNICREIHYKNNNKHGTFKEWYPNGILREIYIHKNNKIIKKTTYDLLGNIKESKNYTIKF